MGNALVDVSASSVPGHARWVRLSHCIVALSVLTLATTGFVILMAHPRLYWGEAGNDLVPALLELPISRNHGNVTFDDATPFFADHAGPISASRTYDIFNQNGWARSLHFIAGWGLVVPGVMYLLIGIRSGHFRSRIWPRRAEVTTGFWRDVRQHLRLTVRPATGGPDYGVLQKCAYSLVVFVAVPLSVLTGLAMAPALTAAYPFLLDMLGGFQSARTIHFVSFAILLLFAVIHVAMVIKSGFRRQMRGITVGR